LTRTWREYIIPKGVWRERTEVLGGSAVAELTTRIADSQRVEFSTNLFGLPFLGLPRRATKNQKTKSTKGGGLSG